MSFADDYAAHCAVHGTPERLEVLLCDLNGIFRGKWLPGDQAAKLGDGALRLPFSTCAPAIDGREIGETGLGIVVGDPDGVLLPIPGTLAPVPWAPRPTAQVLAELHEVPGQPNDLSARAMLARLLDAYAALGWRPVVAAELEFFVLTRRAAPHDPPRPPAFTPPAQNYDLETLARHQPWLDDVVAAADAQGLPLDTITAEYGPGQFEVNFRHGDALAAADHAALFRRLVRGVVARHGLEATFMAKPYADAPGNGFHVHASVLDADGTNIFDTGGHPPLRLGHAIAGTLETLRNLQAVFAPHANSYRRFGPLSFAPTAPEWGFDHRGAAVRVAQAQGPAARLEHRIAGADANPYAVIAAVLGGMLHGLRTEATLPAPLGEGSPPPPLSRHWDEAVARFAGSAHGAALFGAHYQKVFAALKAAEMAARDAVIPPEEYATYLSRL